MVVVRVLPEAAQCSSGENSICQALPWLVVEGICGGGGDVFRMLLGEEIAQCVRFALSTDVLVVGPLLLWYLLSPTSMWHSHFAVLPPRVSCAPRCAALVSLVNLIEKAFRSHRKSVGRY